MEEWIKRAKAPGGQGSPSFHFIHSSTSTDWFCCHTNTCQRGDWPASECFLFVRLCSQKQPKANESVGVKQMGGPRWQFGKEKKKVNYAEMMARKNSSCVAEHDILYDYSSVSKPLPSRLCSPSYITLASLLLRRSCHAKTNLFPAIFIRPLSAFPWR